MKKILIILLLLASTMQAQLLDVFGVKPNYSWVEQLADSNKFYTSVGDWTLTGSGSITRNADSSLTYSNVPAELNPNPNFDDWNYVDVLSGWDFTSGWTFTGGASIDDLNSFTTSASGGIYKTYGTVGKFYKLDIAGVTTASEFKIQNSSPTPSITGTFNEQFISEKVVNTNFYLYNVGIGTTDITNMTLAELIPPTGWTASTMDATNYVIQDDDGLKWVNDGTYKSLYIGNKLQVGHTYKYEIEVGDLTGSFVIGDEVGDDNIINSAGVSSGTWVANGTTFQVKRYTSFTATINRLSLTEVHDENYISLPVTETANQVHELSFDYLKDSNDVKVLHTINNQTDSTNTVTSSYQTETKKFVGGSTDTLKISLSDTGKVKIKNPSIKLRVKQ